LEPLPSRIERKPINSPFYIAEALNAAAAEDTDYENPFLYVSKLALERDQGKGASFKIVWETAHPLLQANFDLRCKRAMMGVRAI
jgi:hypothetical protein